MLNVETDEENDSSETSDVSENEDPLILMHILLGNEDEGFDDDLRILTFQEKVT